MRGTRPGGGRRSWAFELGVAAGLAVFLAVGTVAVAALQGDRARDLDAFAFLLVVAAAAVTVLPRRRAPVWALAGSMVLVSTYLLARYPYGPVQLCMMIAMFEVARRRPLRVSAPVCGLAAVTASVVVLTRLIGEVQLPGVLAVAWAGWIVLPWSLGALVHVMATARERSRRELVARVALEERMRLAREVHDVAGHGLAVVAMQAGVALLVFDEQPEQARSSLKAIESTSAEALAELRATLAALPSDPPVAPGLARLGDLVDRVSSGGLPVELDVPDPALPLAADVDAAAYRVVQESLTNVVRHAGPATAAVRVARAADHLLVQVVDRGRGAPPGGFEPGAGLRGLRGRIEALGGRFEAGPHAGGGFRVAALIPLQDGAR